MLSINTNLSALIVQSNLKQSTNGLDRAIERMTSGYKINSAKDNAANYSINTKLSTKIGAYEIAKDNASMGLDILSTAESSMTQIYTNMSRIRDLVISANNGTNGSRSLEAMTEEAKSILSNVEQIYKSAEYNKIKLFYNEESIIDYTKCVSNQTSFISGETYDIRTSADLIKLQDLVNSGVDTSGVKFELKNDIDMSGIQFRGIGINETTCFKGDFNGQGHIISNLEITSNESYVGLFGVIQDATVSDVGLEDCNIKGGNYTGAIAGLSWASRVRYCYSTGKVSGKEKIGGVVGGSRTSYISNLYFIGSVAGTSNLGGVVGVCGSSGSLMNCYSEGSIVGSDSNIGGLVGVNFDGVDINRSFSKSDVTGWYGVGGLVGSKVSGVYNSFYSGNVIVKNNKPETTVEHVKPEDVRDRFMAAEMKFNEENGWKVVGDDLLLSWQTRRGTFLGDQNEVNLQVGINSTSASSIGFDISFELGDIDVILEQGLDSLETLSFVDGILSTLSQKSTEYGGIQNRLLSVLDEIEIQYNNLVSTQSTIRDADIADVSSEYIKKQILQQASATLLSTANQTPALALTLLQGI